jgi:hypothetical protein
MAWLSSQAAGRMTSARTGCARRTAPHGGACRDPLTGRPGGDERQQSPNGGLFRLGTEAAAQPMPDRPLAAKAIEPLLDIGRIADLARFAVIDDAYAGLRLAAHYIHHRVADLLLERRAVRPAVVTQLEPLNERRRPRQTTGVGRQNMLG